MAYCTPAELADALHTRLSAANQSALQACCDGASEEVDHWLDAGAPLDPVPALVHNVTLARAVEWSKAADAAFGLIGYADIGALRAPRDGFGRHADALLPYKVGFGLA